MRLSQSLRWSACKEAIPPSKQPLSTSEIRAVLRSMGISPPPDLSRLLSGYVPVCFFLLLATGILSLNLLALLGSDCEIGHDPCGTSVVTLDILSQSIASKYSTGLSCSSAFLGSAKLHQDNRLVETTSPFISLRHSPEAAFASLDGVTRLESSPGQNTEGSHVVSSRRYAASAAGPVGVEEFAARFVDAFIGVRSEEVPLCLQEVGRQPTGAISVEER